MADFATVFSEMWKHVFENPIFRLTIFLPLLLMPFTFIRRLMFDDHIDLVDTMCVIGRWFKGKFIGLLKLFIPMPKLIAWKLARPGIDYVDCSAQSCTDCPFAKSCEDKPK